MKLEVDNNWVLIKIYDLWYPFCREHESDEKARSCDCIIPNEVWKKCFFMDQLSKIK